MPDYLNHFLTQNLFKKVEYMLTRRNYFYKRLYACMIFMPVSGIAMGYFSGKGIPFFGYLIPGKKEPVGSIAGFAYKSHTFVGPIFEYIIPFHMSAVGFHALKG